MLRGRPSTASIPPAPRAPGRRHPGRRHPVRGHPGRGHPGRGRPGRVRRPEPAGRQPLPATAHPPGGGQRRPALRDRDPRDRDPRGRDPRGRDPRDRDPRGRELRDREPRHRDPRVPGQDQARPVPAHPSTAGTRRSSGPRTARRRPVEAARTPPGLPIRHGPRTGTYTCTATSASRRRRRRHHRGGRPRTTPRTGMTCWPRMPLRSMNRPAARSSRCCPPVRRLVRSASSHPPSRSRVAGWGRERPPGGTGAGPGAQARAAQGSVPDRGSDRRAERGQALRPAPGPAARADQRLLRAVGRGRARRGRTQ